MFSFVFNLICSIIIIGILVLIYFRFQSESDPYEIIQQEQTKEIIKWLYQTVNDICYHCNMNPIYEIKEATQITYTDKNIHHHTVKGTIYLTVWDPVRNRIFDHNTLIYSVLHEIAHILSPSTNHDPPFDNIETILLNKATELLYYNPNQPLDPNYVTLDLPGSS